MASEGRRELSDERSGRSVVSSAWCGTGACGDLLFVCAGFIVCAAPVSCFYLFSRRGSALPSQSWIPCKFYFGPVLLVLRLSSAVYVWQLGSDRWSSCRRRLASKMMMAVLSAGMGRTGKPQAQAMQGEPMFKVPSLSYPGHAPSRQPTHLHPP